MKSTDHLKMPELISSEYSVRLSDEERKRYEEMKKTSFLICPTVRLPLRMPQAQHQNCRRWQTVRYIPDDGCVIDIHSRKLDAL